MPKEKDVKQVLKETANILDKAEKVTSPLSTSLKNFKLSKRILLISGSALVIFLLILVSILSKGRESPTKTDQTNVKIVESTPADTQSSAAKTFPLQDPGLVCQNNKTFSFNLDVPYSVILESEKGMGITTQNGILLIVSEGEDKDVEKVLQQYSTAFTKDGKKYIYKVPQKEGDSSEQLPTEAISTTKDNFIISVFYDPSIEDIAQKTLAGLEESIKKGCL